MEKKLKQIFTIETIVIILVEAMTIFTYFLFDSVRITVDKSSIGHKEQIIMLNYYELTFGSDMVEYKNLILIFLLIIPIISIVLSLFKFRLTRFTISLLSLLSIVFIFVGFLGICDMISGPDDEWGFIFSAKLTFMGIMYIILNIILFTICLLGLLKRRKE